MGERIYYISYEEECARCGGVGIVVDRRWEQLNEVMRTWERMSGRRPHERVWQDKWNEFASDYVGPNWRKVPEEYECPDCEGTGTRRGRERLEDVLKEVMTKI